MPEHAISGAKMRHSRTASLSVALKEAHLCYEDETRFLELSMSEDLNIKIEEHQYGVWKFKVAHQPSATVKKQLNDFISSLPLVRRLFWDVFGISPVLFPLYIVTKIWGSIDSVIMMHFSHQILQAVSSLKFFLNDYAGLIIVCARLK